MIVIRLDRTLVASLVDRGSDPVIGARSLRNVFEEAVESEVAEAMLSAQSSHGSLEINLS